MQPAGLTDFHRKALVEFRELADENDMSNLNLAFHKCVWAIGVARGSIFTIAAQQQNRIVKEADLNPDSPIMVISWKLGDKKFDKEKRIPGDPDWLRNLKFEVKNVSNKKIMYFYIDLAFPKQGQALGQIPIASFFGSLYARAE